VPNLFKESTNYQNILDPGCKVKFCFLLLAFRAICFRYGIVIVCVIFPHVREAGLNANGPAIWGGCVTRRKHRAGSWYPAPAGPRNCHGARRVWRGFCRHGTNFIARWRGRGTNIIGTSFESGCRIFIEGSGAASR